MKRQSLAQFQGAAEVVFLVHKFNPLTKSLKSKSRMIPRNWGAHLESWWCQFHHYRLSFTFISIIISYTMTDLSRKSTWFPGVFRKGCKISAELWLVHVKKIRVHPSLGLKVKASLRHESDSTNGLIVITKFLTPLNHMNDSDLF